MAVVVVRACCERCGCLEVPAVRTSVLEEGRRWLVHRRCVGCGFRFKGIEVASSAVAEVVLKVRERPDGTDEVRRRVRVRRI